MAPLSLNFKDDKKYKGLTTVWLLSALGNSIVKESNNYYSNKSNSTGNISSSTVKKKDIVNISIPKTCDEIQNFENDFSLRYISNLLYGVTICYNKKTEYVLNDLNHLLVQLQKNDVYAFKAKNKSTRINGLNSNNSIIGNKNNNYTWEECVFFDDDPLYDITKVPALEFLNTTLQDNVSFIEEAKSIRRQDYINELSNSNRFELHGDMTNSDAQSNLGSNVRNSFPLDEIPVDVDFNLDLDDIVSHQGTPLGSHSSSQKDGNDFKFNYQGDELVLNFENDNENNSNGGEDTSVENEGPVANLKDYELGLEAQASEEENDLQQKLNTRMQRGHRADVGGQFSKVQFDAKTSYPNEVLKFNHGNYSHLMGKNRIRKLTGQNFLTSNISSLVRSCGEEEFFSTNWLSIFNDFSNIKTSEWDLYPQGFSSVERGRKRAHSLVSTQSSSSTRSHEYGRKSFRNNKNDNYSSDMENDNLLLNLEQINEDLEDGHYIEENSQGNILDFNLNLPPSSFGRSHTRNSTRSSGFNEDIVGALRRRVGPSEQNFAEEDDSSNSCFSDGSQQNLQQDKTNFQDVILDYQTKKFYDYIKERSIVVGRTTRSNPPFKRKMLLVDIIPSRMGEAQTGANFDDVERGVSRQIAASAFLSLLNLATKGMVKLNEYPVADAVTKDLKLRREDEIIVYA
ncbi:ANL_collapsed_G0056830.mRNA.1.CDS.1 [Saccharomyces cerevisiae]|nr:ANL_HP_G0196600.mRNA.1.CDS.1 [Saccharomyces cerevisiae]CAI4985887.1 ANL_HP_G0043190.mRNA.1.CDS.1 [Saccharomyces cerevisiae]CAI5031861.1 BEM_HP_G0038870.mRNA.1.CDS.1 [Saccharomyces cerevisiae]CAI5052045.1 BEM_HP_G0047660.mRNA.1.CDS.1 [Saccharomyces cerevisiae]CAI5054160.1 BEM_HP_G0048380.mRNA.1.CDS.1 [Saccharomyces cerevisiae]